MPLLITDEVLEASRLSETEFKREIAVFLFEQNRLTLGKASRLADMSQYEFQHLVSSRGLPVHYHIDDFKNDIETLKSLSLNDNSK